ncbi:hypothetical protein BJF90_09195 [Pseudonocardia sp. CNS-004]|nr:hypothetical protein BJF90_09195 [Pseudonocardia sp. CNS-004]
MLTARHRHTHEPDHHLVERGAEEAPGAGPAGSQATEATVVAGSSATGTAPSTEKQVRKPAESSVGTPADGATRKTGMNWRTALGMGIAVVVLPVALTVLFQADASSAAFMARGGVNLVPHLPGVAGAVQTVALLGTFVVNVLWMIWSTFTATGLDAWIFGLYAATVSLFGLYAAFNELRKRATAAHRVAGGLVTWVAYPVTSNVGNALYIFQLGWVAFDPVLLSVTVMLAVAFGYMSVLGIVNALRPGRIAPRYLAVMGAAGNVSLLYWGALSLWPGHWKPLVVAGVVVVLGIAVVRGMSRFAQWRARLIHSPPAVLRSLLGDVAPLAPAVVLGAVAVGSGLSLPVTITVVSALTAAAVLWVLHRLAGGAGVGVAVAAGRDRLRSAARSLRSRLPGGGTARALPADAQELWAALAELRARVGTDSRAWLPNQRAAHDRLFRELERILGELDDAERAELLLAQAFELLAEFDRWVPAGRVARWRAQLSRSHRWAWLLVAGWSIGSSAAGVFGTPVLGGPALFTPGFVGYLVGLATVGPWWGYLERRRLAVASLASTGIGFGVFAVSGALPGLPVVAAVLLGFAGAGTCRCRPGRASGCGRPSRRGGPAGRSCGCWAA